MLSGNTLGPGPVPELAPAEMTIGEIVAVEEALMRGLRAAYQLYDEAIRRLLDHLKSAKLS